MCCYHGCTWYKWILVLSTPSHVSRCLTMCYFYHNSFPLPLSPNLLILARKRITVFFLSPGSLGTFFLRMLFFLHTWKEAFCLYTTHIAGGFSVLTLCQVGTRALYLHSQNWQMVGVKRSIPRNCRRIISTDPGFQSLKDTVQQPNHSTAQHSARSKAGAWNICQDSLTQKGLVSKPEADPATKYGRLFQRDLRATTWCRTASPTEAMWLFDSRRIDFCSIVLSRTISRTGGAVSVHCVKWSGSSKKRHVTQQDSFEHMSPGPHHLPFGARDHLISEIALFGLHYWINTSFLTLADGVGRRKSRLLSSVC